MTYAELIDRVATELVDVVKGVMDDGVGMNDFVELIQAGQICATAWNVLQKIDAHASPEMTRESFIAHVVIALATKGAAVFMPLPPGEVPGQ